MYDKETLGPGTGRGSGVKAWMRWAKRYLEKPVIVLHPEKYLNSSRTEKSDEDLQNP